MVNIYLIFRKRRSQDDSMRYYRMSDEEVHQRYTPFKFLGYFLWTQAYWENIINLNKNLLSVESQIGTKPSFAEDQPKGKSFIPNWMNILSMN